MPAGEDTTPCSLGLRGWDQCPEDAMTEQPKESAYVRLAREADERNETGSARVTTAWVEGQAVAFLEEKVGLTICSAWEEDKEGAQDAQIWIPDEGLPLLIECAQRALALSRKGVMS